MSEDRHLDQQEAWAIAEGFDPRFPLSDEPVYVQWEGRWNTVLTDVTAMCDQNTVGITSAQISTETSWFNEAIADHTADSASNPADQAWNGTWIATYQRLLTMYGAL